MLMRQVALEAVAFAIAVATVSFALNAAEPQRRWRPATTADLPAGTPIQSAASAGSGAPPDAAALRVHIDPATGAIVPAPIDTRADAAANADIDAGAPPLVLQKSPSGVLYVDTTGYQHTATATLDTQGHLGFDCDDPLQDDNSAAHLDVRTMRSAHGDHADHPNVMAETMPASSVPSDAATQNTSAVAAKAEARQKRVAAVSAGAVDAAAAPQATELNDASSRAGRRDSATGSSSSTIRPANPEPRRPLAALPKTTTIPADAASQSTSAEQ